MPTTPKGAQRKNGLSAVEINPIWAIVVAVILVAGLGWFFWMRPQAAADKAAREWTTPEAAAARSPENKPKNPAYDAKVQELLQQEGHANRRTGSRKDQ
jgi:hypothetical protein